MNPLHTLLKHKSQDYQRIVTAFLLGGLFVGCLWLGEKPFFILLGLAFILAMAEWGTMTKNTPFKHLWLLVGGLYITLGFLGIGLTVIHNPVWIMIIFLLIWTTDTGAYFVGRTLGGPKLAPHISPAKTWSGALGGTGFALMAGSFLATAQGYKLSFPLMACFLLISLVSIAGDLLESWVKRRLGIKDSGTLLPGHGGVLDRLDSPLAVGAFLLILFLIFKSWKKSFMFPFYPA